MPKPYSDDLRGRVIEAVEAGASRREVAESFGLSASAAVKWLQRWHDTGSATAKPSGGSISPLEEQADWLLALVAAQPDLTLKEMVAAMRKRRSRSAVWRFCERHNITFKKKPAGDRARATGRGAGTPTLDAGARHV
jgi:transposase